MKKLKYDFQIRVPPNSPDLNPIEWFWQDLKRYIRSKSCKNEEEAALAVGEFKKQLTTEKCRKYIEILVNGEVRIMKERFIMLYNIFI